jgi:hypothetical protein
MLKNTELREAALGYIRMLPSGTVFDNKELYRFLEENFPQECRIRGDAQREERFRNDARWAVQDAKRDKIAKDTGKTGQHQRL